MDHSSNLLPIEQPLLYKENSEREAFWLVPKDKIVYATVTKPRMASDVGDARPAKLTVSLVNGEKLTVELGEHERGEIELRERAEQWLELELERHTDEEEELTIYQKYTLGLIGGLSLVNLLLVIAVLVF